MTKGQAVKTNYRQRWDESELSATVIGGSLNTYKQTDENVAAIDASLTPCLAITGKHNCVCSGITRYIPTPL